MQLNENTWSTWSEKIASPAEPEEYSPASVERLMHEIKDYVVDVKGVHTQFRALNGIQMIDFNTDEERKEYEKAYEKFLMEKAKIQEKMDRGGGVGNGGMQILVEFLKFRQAAEEIKVEYIVDAMYDSVTNHNQAAVAAFNFKFSIAKAVKLLRDKHGVDRNDISLIWGGGNTSMSTKRKKKLDIKKKIEGNKILQDLFAEADIDMYDMGLNTVEETREVDIDESLRLGAQDQKERQKEIDKFQKGRTKFCFFTFKSGGVGLSLHHTDQFTKEKVRRKTSGFAVEEDIPLIPTRQRICFVGTTYSAIELVQGLGRCPRLTSLSDTPQVILFYRGTIEERVAWIVSLKLRCLRKVSQSREKESWESVILGGVKKDDTQNNDANDIKLLGEGKPIVDETADDDSVDLDEGEED